MTLTLDLNGTQYDITEGTLTLTGTPKTTPTPAPPVPTPAPADPAKIHVGATIGGQYNNGHQPPDQQSVGWPAFIKQACGGKSPSLEGGGQDWGTFPKSAFDTIRASGCVPFWTVMSDGHKCKDVAAGVIDAQITSFANAAKVWGHPFWLRFDHEMNGDWYPWWGTSNSSLDYVTMWRHVHGIFTSLGVSNANWVWCVNRIDGLPAIQPLYPGDTYVDWTAFDCYLQSGSASFQSLAQKTYDAIAALAPTKPMMIAEFGADHKLSVDKGAWLTAAMKWIKTLPLIRCVQYYDRRDSSTGPDWPLLDPPAAATAWAKAIADPIYHTNTFGNFQGSLT